MNKYIVDKLLKALPATIILLGIGGCFDSTSVKAAKNESYPRHEGTSFYKILDNYNWCKDKKWTEKEEKTGERYVEFTCTATEPKNIKELIQQQFKKDEADYQRRIVKLKAESDESIAKELESRKSHLKYLADQVNKGEHDVAEDSKNGIVDPSKVRTLESDRKNLATALSPEDTEDFEKGFANYKKNNLEALDREIQEINSSLEHYRESVSDGKIVILMQWHLDKSGAVNTYATAVNFQFDKWEFNAGANNIIRSAIYEVVYQDRPIFDGLRGLFSMNMLQDTTDSSLLYHASIAGLYAKKGQ